MMNMNKVIFFTFLGSHFLMHGQAPIAATFYWRKADKQSESQRDIRGRLMTCLLSVAKNSVGSPMFTFPALINRPASLQVASLSG